MNYLCRISHGFRLSCKFTKKRGLLNLYSLFLFSGLFCAPPLFPEETGKNAEAREAEILLLNTARRAPASESWAKLEGVVQHRKKGSETEEYLIYAGIRFTPQMLFAQIVINNVESYTVNQPFTQENSTTIIKDGDPDSKILDNVGIRAEDLTLSFMYWKADSFLGDENYKTCASSKIALISPDGKEKAVVLVSKQYAFPLKAEWFKNGEDTPYRTMEVSSFKKENDYWFVDEIIIYGPGWKSKVIFNKTKAGDVKNGAPEDLFKKIPFG
jgi:hypothetical protein